VRISHNPISVPSVPPARPWAKRACLAPPGLSPVPASDLPATINPTLPAVSMGVRDEPVGSLSPSPTTTPSHKYITSQPPDVNSIPLVFSHLRVETDRRGRKPLPTSYSELVPGRAPGAILETSKPQPGDSPTEFRQGTVPRRRGASEFHGTLPLDAGKLQPEAASSVSNDGDSFGVAELEQQCPHFILCHKKQEPASCLQAAPALSSSPNPHRRN